MPAPLRRRQAFRLPIWLRLPIYAAAGALSGLVAGIAGPLIGAAVGATVTLIIGVLDYLDAARERARIAELERLAAATAQFQDGFGRIGEMSDRSLIR